MPGVDDFVNFLESASTDEEKEGSSVLSDLKEAVGNLANVIQVAGWVFPYASTAAGLLKSFAGSSGDATSKAIQDLQNSITNLMKAEQAGNVHIDMETIVDKCNNVRTLLDQLIFHGKTYPDVQANLPADAITLERDLGDRAFWTRPYFADLVWRDGWMPSIPPVDGNNMVLDPTVTAAAYQSSINMWLSVLALWEPNATPAEFTQDIGTIADALNGYHNELGDGIRVPSVPDIPSIVFFREPDPFLAIPGPWGLFAHVGAVDIYKNKQAVDRFWPFPDLGGWQQEDIDRLPEQYHFFVPRFQLACNARQKALYITQGLHDFWLYVQHINQIASRPVATINARSSWSFREIGAIVIPLLPKDDNPFLVWVYGLKIIHGLDMAAGRPPLIPGQQEVRSLRQAIAAATP